MQLLIAAALALTPPTDPEIVHGMTVSCQTWGHEWGSDEFAADLDVLSRLGVNWVAIHPYASIGADGTVTARRFDPEHPPEWITRPIREAHARGMSILVIPHIAYWGSPFSWRGEIDFEDPAARSRFFSTYRAWIAGVARAAAGADGFSIGNETDRLVRHEAEWRAIAAAVREQTRARLTYAANFDRYLEVPFWDALDAIGVQAYFPLSESPQPSETELRAAWKTVLAPLRELSARTGKPVVFTEIGYCATPDAARTPWIGRRGRGEPAPEHVALQSRCLAVALDVVSAEREWLRGAFLWKWFAGHVGRGNFLMTTPAMRAVIAGSWGASAPR